MTELIATIEGAVGRLRLNRPQALHALSYPMCEAMIAALLAWREDQSVEAVLIDHAEGRGFCAGGDVRALAESGSGDGSAARTFFRLEYQLNHLLFTYAKPVVAFMDGVTMGGGVGISQPARYRVATERTLFAMPETTIGLFPDVGAGWYLSRLPGRVGQYLALTGARLNGAELHALGLATHYSASSALEDAKARIVAEPRRLETILEEAATTPPDAPVMALREDIDRLFASDQYEDILAALEQDGGAWATRQRELLVQKSPQSCKVSLRLLHEGAAKADFGEEMAMEYGVAVHVCQRPDFAEGVRALLIDKDNAPAWSPPTPEAVTDHAIDTIFAPLPDDEAWQPLRF